MSDPVPDPPFDPICPECRRGSHRCVNCDTTTAHGDLQCTTCAADPEIEVPRWAIVGGRGDG